MSYEPIGKEQPSAAREIPQPSPEIMAELQQKSLESGQREDITTQRAESTDSDARDVAKNKRYIVSSLDEAFAKGLDRKWAELGSRLEPILEPGDIITFDVAGRTIAAERYDVGVGFTVDGKAQDDELSRDFLMRNAVELTKEIREEVRLEEQERQEEYERQRVDANKDYSYYDYAFENTRKEKRREDSYEYREHNEYREHEKGEEYER